MSSKSPCLILLLFMFSANSLVKSVSSVDEGVYDAGSSKVFFFHVPASDNYRDYVYVIGLSDNTQISVYDIADPSAASLATEGSVDAGESFLFKAKAKGYYKIISDKPVVAWLVGGGASNWEDQNLAGCGGSTFYASVNGSYVGREFTYMAGGTYYYHGEGGSSWLGIDVYTPIPPADFETKVYSLQASDVRVYNVAGELLYHFSMGPDMCRSFPSPPWRIYRVVSTGDIILQCAGGGNCFTVSPSASGNIVGKVHYGSTFAWQRGCFLCISYEACEVKVYDMDTGVMLYEHTFTAPGEYWYQGGKGIRLPGPAFTIQDALKQVPDNVGTRNLKFESTGNIVVYVGDTESAVYDDDSPMWIGDDIGFAGGIDAKDFYVYAPTYLVVFAPSDLHLEINGTGQDIKANHYLTSMKSGIYHIVSDEPIIVEVVGTGSGAAATANDYAAYLMSFPDIPTAPPETGGKSTFDIFTVAAGVTVACVTVSLVIIRNKRKTAGHSPRRV